MKQEIDNLNLNQLISMFFVSFPKDSQQLQQTVYNKILKSIFAMPLSLHVLFLEQYFSRRSSFSLF